MISAAQFISEIPVNLQKVWQTMKVTWSNLMVYKVNFFLHTLGPVFVFFFIKFSLWTSVFKGDFETLIGNYDLKTMLTYHLWTMIVILISRAYNSEKLSEDIRLGKISTYLIYPFSFWEYHASRYLAHLGLQSLIALFTSLILYLGLGGYISGVTLEHFFYGFLLSLLVSFFWFSLHFLIGLGAFWLEETWTLLVVAHILIQFLSGAIIPLDLYPAWAVQLLNFTPFPYVTYVPVKVFMGADIDLIHAGLQLVFWSLLINIAGYLMWKKGLRLYTGAGM